MNALVGFCKKRWLWLVAALVLLLGGAAWQQGWLSPKAEVKYKTVKLDKGTITATVSASGTITPVSSVQVGSQVSGQIKELRVDFNSEVKAGQIIARIDPEIFEYRVRQAQADVDSARAQQLVAQSTLSARRADLSRAEVNFIEAKSDAQRKQTLFDKQFISSAERDKAASLVKTQEEDLKTAKANIEVAQAQVKSADSTTKQRIAGLDSAKGDLARTIIKSPVDGIVIKRSIETGQTVAASLSAPELFVIAKNLRDMQVETAIDESDIGKIKTGMRATFTVDAFSGRSFTGEVSQVRKAAQTVQNVVTYIAVISFSNTDGMLLPGMTANARIVINERVNVLRVANAALRFKPAAMDEKSSEKTAPTAGGAAALAGAEQARPQGQQGAGVGGQGGGGGGALRAYRERLEKELVLTETQKKQLEDIYAGMRERFAAIRDLPEDVRPKAMANIRADLREKTAAMLTAEQKPKFEAINAEIAAARSASGAGGSGSGAPARGRLWILDETGKPKGIDIRTGASDGSVTEILNAPDTLKEGTEVLSGVQAAGSAKPAVGGLPRPPF
jgi:HlyD family secretion protein